MMSLSKIPRDKIVWISDILTYSDINELIEGVRAYAPKLKGIVVVGMDDEGTTALWSAGLSVPEMVYVSEVIKGRVMKPDNQEEDEDDE